MITSEQLHDWYLEATKKLKPESYNPKAQKQYKDLTDEQKHIDEYISEKINAELAEKDEQIKLLSHNNTMRRVELQQKRIEELEEEIAKLRNLKNNSL